MGLGLVIHRRLDGEQRLSIIGLGGATSLDARLDGEHSALEFAYSVSGAGPKPAGDFQHLVGPRFVRQLDRSSAH